MAKGPFHFLSLVFHILFILSLSGCEFARSVTVENLTDLSIDIHDGYDYRGNVEPKTTKKIENVIWSTQNPENLIPVIGRTNNEIVFFLGISWRELEKRKWHITIYPEDKEKAERLLNAYARTFVKVLDLGDQEYYALLHYLGGLQNVVEEIKTLFVEGKLSGEVLVQYERYLKGEQTYDDFDKWFWEFGGDFFSEAMVFSKMTFPENWEENY